MSSYLLHEAGGINHLLGTEHKTCWMKKASDEVTGLDDLSMYRLPIKSTQRITASYRPFERS